jgi:hypothetical protein
MAPFSDTESPTQGSFQNQTRLLAYLFLLGFLSVSIQSVCGLSLRESLISTTYLIATSVPGAIIWRSLKPTANSLEELTGMGMALGSIAVALINIIYRSFSYGIPIATLMLCILAIGLFCVKKSHKEIFDQSHFRTSIYHAQFIAVCVLGYISAISNYVFPYFIASIIALIISQLTKRYSKVHILLYVTTMSIGWCVANVNKSLNGQNFPFWRWISNDAIYDTSYSVGIGRFGIRDNILYSNHSSKGYLLTYSWAGEFANITQINQLSISTLSFAVFGLLGIGFATLTIGKFLLQSVLASHLSVALIFCQASFPEPFLLGEYLKLNNTISILWLLCLVYTILHVKAVEIRSSVITLCVLIPVVTYGKFHFGIVAILFSTYLFDFRSSFTELKQVKFASFYKQIVMIGLPAIISIVVFFKLINFPNRWPYSFKFDSWIVSNAVLLVLFRFIGLRSRGVSDLKRYVLTSNLIVLSSLSYYLYSMGANNSIYIVSAAVILCAFPLAGIVDTAIEKLNHIEKIIIYGICSFSFLAAFLISRDHTKNFWNYLRPGALSLKRSLYLNYQYLILPLTFVFVVSCLLFLFTLKNFRTLLTKSRFAPLAILVVISMNFGLFLSIPLKSVILNSQYGAGIKQSFPIDTEIVEAGEYIRDNTSRLSIVASNRICNAELPDSMETPGWPAGTMPECGNLNFLTSISAISERRQFLEAPVFENTIGPFLTTESFLRYKILLRLFASPNDDDITYLKNSGVNVLFLDRSIKFSPQIYKYGRLLFQNQTVTIFAI